MRHRNLIAGSLLSLNLAFAAAAYAQFNTPVAAPADQVTAAPTHTESHREKAVKLFELMDVKANFMAGFMTGIEPHLKQMEANLPADKYAQVRQAFIRFGQTIANDPELTQRLVGVYLQLFTEQELTDLVNFYSTPTGRKFLKSIPQITQQSAIAGEQLGMKYQAQLASEVQAILQAPAAQ